jgi:peptidyl-prolyl cis-trans isomerase C
MPVDGRGVFVMQKKLLRAALLALCVVGAGQAQETPDPVTLVKVDDFAVTNLHLALFASQTGRNPQDAAGQIDLLNELVNNFMVANSAQGQALAQTPEVASALEVARARLIAQTFIRRALRESDVDEARLRELYEAEYGDGNRQEYKARHILLETQEDAEAVIVELEGGADFATLAAERSTGPSKAVGGDLGWFEPDQMVAEFSAATAQLADGAYSKSPVETQFGWHVILREDSRELPPPSFESVKPELEKQVQQELVAKAIAEIRENTRLEVQNLTETD